MLSSVIPWDIPRVTCIVLVTNGSLCAIAERTTMLYTITGRCSRDLTGCDLLPGQSGLSEPRNLH